ncbi:MAG: hypothetical protein LUD81_04270 [Clostridiales bacterium]|nr:hypothetical protein [Clostridiales bacterium]
MNETKTTDETKVNHYLDILKLYDSERKVELLNRKKLTENFCNLLYSAVTDETEADKILRAAAEVTRCRADESFLNGYLAAERIILNREG